MEPESRDRILIFLEEKAAKGPDRFRRSHERRRLWRYTVGAFRIIRNLGQAQSKILVLWSWTQKKRRLSWYLSLKALPQLRPSERRHPRQIAMLVLRRASGKPSENAFFQQIRKGIQRYATLPSPQGPGLNPAPLEFSDRRPANSLLWIGFIS